MPRSDRIIATRTNSNFNPDEKTINEETISITLLKVDIFLIKKPSEPIMYKENPITTKSKFRENCSIDQAKPKKIGV